MKRWICLTLAIVMALTMASVASALEGPINARFIYHSLIEQMASQNIDYNDNRIWNFHKENSGIDVVIEPALVDLTQEKQRRAMILASGDVPDLMVLERDEYFNYAVQGVLLSTDDYLDSMPNYMSLVSDASRDACRVDGVLYGFPSSHEEIEMFDGNGIVVRKDIFDTLGLGKEPQTLDEYYEMFKLVKEQTGMIPFVGKAKTTDSDSFDSFRAAFGVLSTTKEVDGKLVYTWAQPEYRDYLEYMNKLYSEELIDTEYVSANVASLQEKFLNSQAFSACLGWADPCVTINGVLEKVEGSKLAYLPQPTKDEVTPAELKERFPVQRFNVIPAMAKNPELAVQFIEYMSSPEAKLVQDRGIEGTDYTLEADGSIEQTLEEQNGVGWKIVYEYIPTPESFQVRLFMKGFDGSFYGLLDQRENSNVVGVRDATIFLPPNEDYLDLEQQLGLKTYVDEQTDKFIMGVRPLSEWDNFLAELEQRGLSRLEAALNDWADLVK